MYVKKAMALLYGSAAARNRSLQGSPELWPQLGGEEVRGPSSEAVSAGVADTVADSTAVEPLMAPPVLGVQQPPRWVGKRFRDRFAAAPLKV
jgi:hypothetical protein